MFLLLVTIYLFILSIERKSLWLAFFLGIVLSLTALTKEVATPYSNLILIALLASAIYKFVRAKDKFFIKIFLATLLGTQIGLLPVKLYYYQAIGKFTSDPFPGSSSPAKLWFLTEEMLINNPSSKHQWLTQVWLKFTQTFKQKYQVPLDQPNRLAFESALVYINVPGREGTIVNPETRVRMTGEDWADLANDYWLRTILNNPMEAWSSLLHNAYLLLWHDNDYFLPNKKSNLSNNSSYKAVPFTMLPYSLVENVDPKLNNLPLIDSTDAMDEYHVYTDKSKTTYYPNVIAIMVNRDSAKAFLVPEQGLSIWIQKTFRLYPLMRLLLPIFIIALIIACVRRKYWQDFSQSLIALYILGSAIFFSLTPLLAHGEARYRLQFTHFFLLFVIYILSQLNPKIENK